MNSILGKFITVWLHPIVAFQKLKEEGEEASIVPSMIYIVVMAALSGVISATRTSIAPPEGFPAMPTWAIWVVLFLLGTILAFIISFGGAFFIWAIVHGLLKGSMVQYKSSYRLFALLASFAPVGALLSIVPLAGAGLLIALNVWQMIVAILGIVTMFETRKLRTWVICVILFGFSILFGWAARLASQRLKPSGPSFGKSEDIGAGDLGLSDDKLTEELDALSEKTKSEPKK